MTIPHDGLDEYLDALAAWRRQRRRKALATLSVYGALLAMCVFVWALAVYGLWSWLH